MKAKKQKPPAKCHPERPELRRGLCNACVQREAYWKNRERYIGYVKKDYQKNKEQRKAYRRKFAKENREKLRKKEKAYRDKNIEKCRQNRRDWVFKNYEREMVTSARQRAKLNNLEFSIDHTDIVLPDKCPYLGIDIIRGFGKRGDNSPSLDRIDSTRGYTKDNIIVISYRANRIKNDATLEELELITAAVRKELQKRNEQKTPIPTVE
jgi:hypothetical protein